MKLRKYAMLSGMFIVGCSKQSIKNGQVSTVGTELIKSTLDPMNVHDVENSVDTYTIQLDDLKEKLIHKIESNANVSATNLSADHVHINHIYNVKVGVEAVRTVYLDSIENEANELIDSVLLFDNEGDVLASQVNVRYSTLFPTKSLKIDELENGGIDNLEHLEVKFYYNTSNVTSSIFRYQIALEYEVVEG